MQERISYDLFEVNPISMTISNRRFDGESVMVLHRMSLDEYKINKGVK